MRRSDLVTKILDKWPGKNVFGIYRFMPLFFIMGAALEYAMISWDFKHKVNFYRTYKKRQVEKLADEALRNHYSA
ncbi:sloth 1 [Rhodnius prolixus]|uniref:Small integral membrane protein 4 n=2 Tax=Rhodnius TaxID=13248 RepID=R4G8H1_RHOPR